MRNSLIIRATTAAALMLPAAAATAQQYEVPGELRIYEENDWFNPFTEQTDRFYTQGLRVEWLSHSSKRDSNFLPGISHADWCLLCGAGAASGAVNTGYAGGQNLYTPQIITIAEPQPNDRPWAGYIYGSRIARITFDEPVLKAKRQDRIEVSLGIVGPASLAKQTQILWHKLIDSPHPEGWDNQLRNEPVVQLRYESALRWPSEGGDNADIIPRVRGNLGNGLTSLEAELTGRIGRNLSGFGALIIPTPTTLAAPLAIRAPEAAPSRSKWLSSFNVFGRAGIKAVAHNIFLDGNIFADNDLRIRRKPFVTEFALGAEANVVGNFWVTAQFIRRGSEFESRSGRDAPAQHFGAISAAWTFDH
jgi:lipid A 3-O-deacylase